MNFRILIRCDLNLKEPYKKWNKSQKIIIEINLWNAYNGKIVSILIEITKISRIDTVIAETVGEEAIVVEIELDDVTARSMNERLDGGVENRLEAFAQRYEELLWRRVRVAGPCHACSLPFRLYAQGGRAEIRRYWSIVFFVVFFMIEVIGIPSFSRL